MEDNKLQKELDKIKKENEALVKDKASLDAKHAEHVQELQKIHAAEVEKLATELQKKSTVPLTGTSAKEYAEQHLNKADAVTKTSALDLASGNSYQIRTDDHKRAVHHNDVKFEVTNSKDSGMPKGFVVVSREVADLFEKAGYGKITE